MRRAVLLILTTTLVASVACGDRREAAPAADDLLYLRSGAGVAVVNAGAGGQAFKRLDAVPSGDWSTIVHTISGRGSTEVVATDPTTDVDRWRDVVEGNLKINVVSHSGDLVALSPSRERYYRYGRSETTFVIVGRELEEERVLTVEGNFEPEAFSADGSSLFVVSYLPARAPSQYQVRRLDLTTGAVHGVFTPHDELQDRMGGTARIQTASADGSRLYTLYTVPDGNGHQHAFVHVLDLKNEWAHCVDLPEGFATKPESSTALTLSPDGDRLYVANTSTGSVAEIDTETLLIPRTETFDLDTRGNANAAVDPTGTLYVTSGVWVVAIDIASFSEIDRWPMTDRITGLQVGSRGRNVYVGLPRGAAVLDVETGTTEPLDMPGVGRIRQFGPVVEPVEEEPLLKCAC